MHSDPIDVVELASTRPDPVQLLEVFGRLGRSVAAEDDVADALAAVTRTAVQVVPGVRWASVSRGTRRGFTTLAATDAVATASDRLQYELGTGPCVAAVADDAVVASSDVAHDDRWGTFGPRVAAELGVGSVLSQRLRTESDDDLEAGLNLYGDRPDAFDDTSYLLATLLATHAAPAVLAVHHRQRAENLSQALDSNREIGVAMGILMTTYKITRDQAFDLLRIASQTTNRKLREIAGQVADTGSLELPSRRPRDPSAGTGAPRGQ